MVSFLCKFRPRSVQAKHTAAYKRAVVSAYRMYHKSDATLLEENLYGIAYYFHKRPTEMDADNLSKPIWDALETILYEDDRAIKIRYAGTFAISEPGAAMVLHLERMPEGLYHDFLQAIDAEDHIIYIEVGTANLDLYRIGVE